MSEKNENEIPQVGEVDPSKETSPIMDEDTLEKSAAKAKNTPCWFNGRRYSSGAQICSAGRVLTCSFTGRWHYGRDC